MNKSREARGREQQRFAPIYKLTSPSSIHSDSGCSGLDAIHPDNNKTSWHNFIPGETVAVEHIDSRDPSLVALIDGVKEVTKLSTIRGSVSTEHPQRRSQRKRELIWDEKCKHCPYIYRKKERAYIVVCVESVIMKDLMLNLGYLRLYICSGRNVSVLIHSSTGM